MAYDKGLIARLGKDAITNFPLSMYEEEVQAAISETMSDEDCTVHGSVPLTNVIYG